MINHLSVTVFFEYSIYENAKASKEILKYDYLSLLCLILLNIYIVDDLKV